MQSKKNLYKIIFITILLGFIISLVGCNWLSLGLINVFDPQAQIRLNYTGVDLVEGSISLEVYSLNEAEFIGSGFEYEYYNGTTKITSLSKMVGVTFYVEPSTSPGTPGPITKIDNMPLYFQEVLDYLTLNPLVTELTCNISMVGVDGAGHSISETVTVNLPALQPGIDFVPPIAQIVTIPAETIGTTPFVVIFDASGSYDMESGISSIIWDFGDGTTGTGITENHTYDIPGLYFVTLTVTDFYGNTGYDTVIVIANEPEAPEAVITTTPAAVSGTVTGSAPFEVYFNAYESSSPESESGVTIVSYSWDFGDGSSATGVTKSHTYSNIGTYTVVLTVTDSNGKKGYASVNIKVEKELTVVINTTPDPPTGTVPFTVYFDAYGSDSESGIVDYSWDFGDGGSGTGITTSHTYSTVGTYTVILTITDSNGYEAYDSVNVNVNELESEATVILTAIPPTISPGSSSAIIANCTDDSGSEVPDGTVVAFGTVGGGTLTVYASGLTTNGIANASLKIDIAGTVTVVATTIYASGSVIVTCE